MTSHTLHRPRACAAGAVLIAMAITAPAARADEAAARNHPPEIRRSSKGQWLTPEGMIVRCGKEIRFNVLASDQDGDPLAYTAEGLPQGARFDAEVQEFAWTPGPEALGEHRIRFVVSDGTTSVARVMRLTVVEDRAPTIGNIPRSEAASGRVFRLSIPGRDEDGDDLAYQAAELPRGAELDGRSGLIRWEPEDDQIGTHTLRVRVSDGQRQSETATAQVEVVEEWESKLLPGAYFGAYWPHAEETFGQYRGVVLELVFYSWVHRNENRGPSHGRVYMRGEILGSTLEDAPVAFIYALGTELSLERNPHRRWLLPFFGLDVGGIAEDSLGHRFQVTPHLGVHLWASRNIYVSAMGGYVVTPSELESLRGWSMTLGGNFTLW